MDKGKLEQKYKRPNKIFKRKEKTIKKHYYDFGYYFSNKDSGSIYIITEKLLDTDDIDECVKYVFSKKLIYKSYINNIVYIEELSEEEAKDMGINVEKN